MSTNIFLLGTEYHLLLTLSIIEAKFSGPDYHNLLVVVGKRLTAMDVDKLPANIEVMAFDFDKDPDGKANADKKILALKPAHIFVFHTYRPLEVYLLSSVPTTTGRHLVQDGSVFYTRVEKNMFFTQIKNTWALHKMLRNKGVRLGKIVPVRKSIKQSQLIDDIWLTNPEIYVEAPGKPKPKVYFKLFPFDETRHQYSTYFKAEGDSKIGPFEDYLMFLPPHLREDNQMQKCVELLKELIAKLGKRNLLIKIHPNSSQKQLDFFKKEFGDVVIKNHIPAELYFANASDTIIVAAASTSLFYYNPLCTYFALIRFFQNIGLYPDWKHVNLPEHVVKVNELNAIYQQAGLSTPNQAAK
jgi:hypothetical protein